MSMQVSDQLGYPPLDTPKPFAPDVFVVDSVMPGLIGKLLPVRMTIIRLANGDLMLHSPTPFSRRLGREVEALGPVRHLVAPNSVHWMFVRDWQQACPDATAWAAPGLRNRRQVRRSGLRLDHDLPGSAAAVWDGIELVVVPGGLGFREVALFHRRSETLVLTDLVLNLEPHKLPAWFRPLARRVGTTAPDGMPPPWSRAAIRLRRREAAEAAAAVVALAPKRVLFAHGKPFERDGAGSLQRSMRWLLD